MRSRSRQNILHPEWQNYYKSALLETSLGKISERVETAEDAINLRLRELSEIELDGPEWQAANYALRFLRLLRENQDEI